MIKKVLLSILIISFFFVFIACDKGTNTNEIIDNASINNQGIFNDPNLGLIGNQDTNSSDQTNTDDLYNQYPDTTSGAIRINFATRPATVSEGESTILNLSSITLDNYTLDFDLIILLKDGSDEDAEISKSGKVFTIYGKKHGNYTITILALDNEENILAEKNMRLNITENVLYLHGIHIDSEMRMFSNTSIDLRASGGSGDHTFSATTSSSDILDIDLSENVLTISAKKAGEVRLTITVRDNVLTDKIDNKTFDIKVRPLLLTGIRRAEWTNICNQDVKLVLLDNEENDINNVVINPEDLLEIQEDGTTTLIKNYNENTNIRLRRNQHLDQLFKITGGKGPFQVITQAGDAAEEEAQVDEENSFELRLDTISKEVGDAFTEKITIIDTGCSNAQPIVYNIPMEIDCQIGKLQQVAVHLLHGGNYTSKGLCYYSKARIMLRKTDNTVIAETGKFYINRVEYTKNKIDDPSPQRILTPKPGYENMCVEDITQFAYKLYDEKCAYDPLVSIIKFLAKWCEGTNWDLPDIPADEGKCFYASWDGNLIARVTEYDGATTVFDSFDTTWQLDNPFPNNEYWPGNTSLTQLDN